MKLVFKLLLFTTLFFSSFEALAKNSSKSNQKKSLRTTKADFSGATINGKYAHSPDAQVSIEKEKNLISVVKPREKIVIQLKKNQEDYK